VSNTPVSQTSVPFLDQHHLLLRRLHSLSGIVPIGVFLIAHLVTNSSIAWGKFGLRGDGKDMSLAEGGAFYFHKEVVWLNESVPHLLLIELTLWAAIAFHSILGLFYAMTGRSNTARYGYWANWRYTLQRISGYIGILFIFYHVATLRWGWTFLIPGGTAWSHHYASSTLALILRGGTEITPAGALVALFYFVGITLLVFHFANGLWTAAITWGLTVSERAQRQWGYACAGIGGGLMLAAWSALFGFFLLNPADATRVETAYYQKYGQPIPAREHLLNDPSLPAPTPGAKSLPAPAPNIPGGK